MKDARIKDSVSRLLDLFREGSLPEKIALATNPGFNVPSCKWSLNNRLLQLIQGTMDGRGIKQWREAGRKVKKGTKAIYILAPREFSYYQCECGQSLYNKDIEKGTCPKCSKPIDPARVGAGILFKGVPVFRAEDTEGKDLPYENIPLPNHRFIDVAKAWGLEVKSSAFLGTAYGYYKRNEKIVLASPEELVFYHELAHAAHQRTGLMRNERQDPSNEIVAEFVAATLAFMEGKTAKLRNCYDYLEYYAAKKSLSMERSVLLLLSEIEKVVELILDAEKKQEAPLAAETHEEMISHGMVY
ncbi:MAG: hypothetical protein ABII22_04490 [Candidatus Micrarchaeota archaeon]